MAPPRLLALLTDLPRGSRGGRGARRAAQAAAYRNLMGEEALRRQLERRDPDPASVVAVMPVLPARTRSPQLARAADLLYVELAGERQRPAAELFARAEAAGISPRTLKRAKRLLGVEVHRHGFGPGSQITWQLRLRWLPAEVVVGLLRLERAKRRKAP